MGSIFRIDDNLANKISYYHFMLLMASLPFDMFYSHLILISLALHTLIYLKNSIIKPVFKTRTFVLQSVFFITVLSTIYTINTREAFNEWGKHITILFFPLVFCFNPIDIKKYRQKLLLLFAVVCTATIVYLYADALITIRHYKLPFKTLFSEAFTNHNFSGPIAIHATFFSMQVTIALVYLLSILIGKKTVGAKFFFILCCIILSAGLIQLGSKSILITLIIIINIAIPYFLLKDAWRWRFVLISASLSILVTIGILSFATFKERYINTLKRDLTTKKTEGGLDSRFERWKVSAKIISEAPIIGHGAGSEIGLLQDGFYNNKLYNSYLLKLNTHSQLLSFLIKSGGIGLLIYLFTLGYGLKITLRKNDLLFFTFITIITMVSLSENLFDVDKGVFFYAFFFSFFIFSNEHFTSKPKSIKAALIFKLKATKRAVVPSSI